MKKDSILQTALLIVAIAAFIAGVFFLIRLVNGPGGKDTKEAKTGILSGEPQTYTDPDYGFSFNYPADFKASKFPEGEGETILVQPAGSGGEAEKNADPKNRQGFQIYLGPYAQKEPLSMDLIRPASGGREITGDEKISLGPDKIEAVSFAAGSPTAGSTREIWFVRDGIFYQATAYAGFGAQMEEILQTIKFN